MRFGSPVTVNPESDELMRGSDLPSYVNLQVLSSRNLCPCCQTGGTIRGPLVFAELDEDGFIRHVVYGKPLSRNPTALVGLAQIRESQELIGEHSTEISTHLLPAGAGGIILTDGIEVMIRNGAKIRTFPVENCDFDCGVKPPAGDQCRVSKKYRPTSINSEHHHHSPSRHLGTAFPSAIQSSDQRVSIGDPLIVHYSVRESIIGSYGEDRNAVLHHSVIGGDSSYTD